MSVLYYAALIIWQWMKNAKKLTECCALVTVFLAAYIVARKLVKNYNLPPGPWGMPYFGYLFFMKDTPPHLKFDSFAKKYGGIFSLRLGPQLVVVINDYNVIRETFRREEFTGRPHNEFMKILGGYGIINAEGAMWKEQRRFLHHKLRKFGMTFLSGPNKSNLQSKISLEVNILIKRLAERRGAPTNISQFLATSISNVICSLMMNIRFQQNETRFKRFMCLIEEGFKLFGNVDIINYIPLTRFLPCMQKNQIKISENHAEMAKFFQETVNQHRETFEEDSVRDIVDTYLLEIQQAKNEGREDKLFQGKNHDRHIQQILGDLFSAGMETVKTTLEWAVLLMLHHPDKAKAVQEELDEVVGRSRMPTIEDLSSLPVTDATIREVLRICSIVPLGTPHATTQDVTLKGYKIPAGTTIVPLLYAVHMDPKLWNDPEAFRPSRFLTSEGKVHTPEYFMPFGVGRRMCLGDVLARMELFTFFSSLMHTFDLRLPESASLPSLKGNAGVTLSPDPFEICLLQRNFECSEIASNPLRNIGSH